jgi:hypothetical protein
MNSEKMSEWRANSKESRIKLHALPQPAEAQDIFDMDESLVEDIMSILDTTNKPADLKEIGLLENTSEENKETIPNQSSNKSKHRRQLSSE